MEVYIENQEIVDSLEPVPYDNSFSLETIVKTIGVRAKSYCKSSINKYLFSFGQSWLIVCPRRSGYAVLGRLFPREHFRVLRSTIDYDYFCERSALPDCVSLFDGLVAECLRVNYELR